jgi:cytochrome P450
MFRAFHREFPRRRLRDRTLLHARTLQGLAAKVAFIDVCRRAHEYIEYYIRQALKDTPQEQNPHDTHRSMVQGLAAQTNDMTFIRSQILQGMLASQETIPVLVSNTMFLLARHPSEWVQPRAEVLSYGEDLYTFHNLSSFKPLQNILNEGMSAHLPVNGNIKYHSP